MASSTLTVAPPRDLVEAFKCAADCAYFLEQYVKIYDATAKRWRPFLLWPAQRKVLKQLQAHKQIVILKARQLGLTWLVLGYFLWLMLFHPAATILLFSKRQEEAWELISRLKGMYRLLPSWLQAQQVMVNNNGDWELSNGSRALANASDSYTATAALVDECDLIEGQEKLIDGLKPTTDAGGQLFLLSRVNKATPGSYFQRIYVAAKELRNTFFPIFLPWNAHPERTDAWYAAQQSDALATKGRLDTVQEQYPATDVEALAPRALGRLIYDCFDPDIHIVDDFPIPHDWLRYSGMDFGGVNTAALFIAVNPKTQEAWAYREYLAGGRTAEQHVTALSAGEPRTPVTYGGAGSEDQWRREFGQARWPIARPKIHEVEVQILSVYGLLSSRRLRIFRSCQLTIGQIQTYSRVLDTAQQPTEAIENKATYHLLDCLRYIGWYLEWINGGSEMA